MSELKPVGGAANDTLLTTRGLRTRYGGRSAMWVWRMLQTEKTFPRPIKIRNQNFWRLSELVAYEDSIRRAPDGATS